MATGTTRSWNIEEWDLALDTLRKDHTANRPELWLLRATQHRRIECSFAK
jgi:hypothetical protein